MTGGSQTEFKYTTLDQELLAAPFEVQTNWQVIAGAPCSGKSTVIDLLAEQGFQTVLESGRKCVEIEMAKGRSIDDIRDNLDALQFLVKDMQLEVELGLQPEEVVFLDGAVPSCLTWYRVTGLDPNEVLPDCFHHRYACVFIFDPLPFQADGARDGDAPVIGYLDEWLFRDFGALGYDVVRVPVMSIQERLDFVLEKLSEQGLGQ